MTRRQLTLLRAWLLCPAALVIAGCSMLGLGAPTATPTAAPTATPPPPTAAPPSPTPDFMYQDSFTDPASGWPAVDTDTTKAGYHPPDAYHLEVSAPDTAFWIMRQQDFGDFSAELQAYTENASETGQWRHGLLFRATAEDRFYAFLINPRTQGWGVYKRTAPASAAASHLARAAAQASEWATLAEGSNTSLTAEPKAVNTLRVDAQGPNLTFSINGQGVVTLSDGEFASGDFGFVLETHDATLAHIHFDVLTVRAFDPARAPAAPTLPVTPTPTGTPTETPTLAAVTGQPQATFDATSFVATSQALGTVIPPGATLACGVAGVPCPQTLIPPAVGSLVPPAVGSAIPNIVGSVAP